MAGRDDSQFPYGTAKGVRASVPNAYRSLADADTGNSNYGSRRPFDWAVRCARLACSCYRRHVEKPDCNWRAIWVLLKHSPCRKCMPDVRSPAYAHSSGNTGSLRSKVGEHIGLHPCGRPICHELAQCCPQVVYFTDKDA